MTQVEVLLAGAIGHGFDYLVPNGMTLAEGDIVSVPFGRGEALGAVWGKGTASIAGGRIKNIAKKYDFPPLDAELRNFIDWAAWYNCASRGAMLKMTLPLSEIDKEGRIKAAASPLAELHLARLSDSQGKAASALEGRIGQGFSVTLLDGVTGSGKTEVYFDAMAQALYQDAQNQVLVLLPEIALSVQWLERFEQRFGFLPERWNSEVTPARKRAAWQGIARGSSRVVVGARSALFLPYRKLALLVVDEEHDGSYKQEEGVIYHARDMAVARARFEKLPAVLVSATPSLESYCNARSGKYTEVSLPARHASAAMPEVRLIDMRQQSLDAGTFVSPSLRKALADTLQAGRQSLLFLNRRGYAPLLLCRKCGHRFQCPNCTSWLVLHKRKTADHLQCHHCGYGQNVPPACPECQAEGSFHACGPGIERLQEEVESFLPQARLAVMASDADGLTQIIDDMTGRRIDVLIGTQMAAKGYHFPGLTLVGVVDADLGLGGGDLRAGEHTYQLLHQLSGRAGREKDAGQVLVQSFLPEHPVMQALATGDREAFLQAELKARKGSGMPPFGRLAALIVEGEDENEVSQAARRLAATAPQAPGIRVFGPAPAPLYLLRGRYRQRLLARAQSGTLSDYMRSWVESGQWPRSLRLRIDIDPQSFL